jgi:Protein of unknown function (DUF3307)
MNVIFLLSLFQIKHLVCDFFLQAPYQYLNKGKYGHPGGLLHVGIHCMGSIWVMAACRPDLHRMFWLIIGEAIIHYHVDWAKIQIGDKFNWKPTNSDYFWWLLGIDQFVHQITYVVMVYFLLISNSNT